LITFAPEAQQAFEPTAPAIDPGRAAPAIERLHWRWPHNQERRAIEKPLSETRQFQERLGMDLPTIIYSCHKRFIDNADGMV
jgi:hypothetical protein